MKKTITVFMVAAVLSLLLGGCDGGGETTTKPTTPTTATGTAVIPDDALVLYTTIPASTQELPVITVAELKAMLDSGEDVIVVDVNTASMYRAGHIPGALHMGWHFDGFSEDPNLSKSVLLVFYCTCEHEEDSGLMALSAVTKYGYRNIKLLLGGNPAWKDAGYTFETS